MKNKPDDLISILEQKETFYPFMRSGKCRFGVPNTAELNEFMELIKAILFPGYFSRQTIEADTFGNYLKVNLLNMQTILTSIIHKGYCFDCENDEKSCAHTVTESAGMSERFIETLPLIKELLISDIEATFLGDPASKSHGEVILCYPVIQAMIHYRVAHQLYKSGVPIVPRMITEMAHSLTGIDIHPGAEIGKNFTIDHGTGVVIGETCVIGNNVKLYQGVTLGAKSFPLDDNGNPIKGIARHPIVGNNVIIYANATILGRIRIGENAVIGGNTWVTRDVPANEKVLL
ncbi:MAG: serine acetyltransferase [Bacteroidetes bacterium HGW-Bacteroidetes-6]|jgi:serine O-acetyltransferase|nr:MAG: serine acetyltransferase [Bacteroidetes bacterium HGW-Bacteroidetes-6]